MEYNLFINELKCYNGYKKDLYKLKEKIDLLWHKIGGIKGVDPSKEPVRSVNKELLEQLKLEELEKIERLENEYKRIKSQIDSIDTKLSLMSEKVGNIYKAIYFDKKSFYKIAKINNCSIGAIRYLMLKEYEKISTMLE